MLFGVFILLCYCLHVHFSKVILYTTAFQFYSHTALPGQNAVWLTKIDVFVSCLLWLFKLHIFDVRYMKQKIFLCIYIYTHFL